MKVVRHLAWIIPLIIIGLLAFFWQVGALQVSRDAQIRRWARAFGVSPATLLQYSAELRGGVDVEEVVSQKLQPHSHGWQAGVQGVEDEETGVFLNFAHLGDGEFPGEDRPFQTTYTMVHNSSLQEPINGVLEFFDDEGNTQELEIDGVTASQFPFQLARGRVKRFVTSGAGPLKNGWARIRAEQPIVATSSFGIIREDGTVITDVGVDESVLGTKFTIFADTTEDRNTGLALANPNQDQTIAVRLTLRDTGGTTLSQTVIELEPFGHVARFVDELFPGFANINEFEGTILLESASEVSPAGAIPGEEVGLLEFAGLTLLVSGSVLTSVPLVQPPRPDADFTNLAFPQAADGVAGNLKVSTTAILFNNTQNPASGVIEFFKGDGTPNEISVVGKSTDNILFDIEPGGVYRVNTDGTGELAVGWARVTMDQPLAGVAIFTIRDSAGEIVAAVGVGADPLRRNFELFANSLQRFNTGVALVNPLEPEEGQADVPVTFRVTLLNAIGAFVARTDIQLSARQHTSLFLSDLFPEVSGIDEFDGRAQISVLGNDNFAAAVSLRSAVEKLTSVPIFAVKRAFAPSVEVRFAQHLADTSPAVRFSLHENSFNWALDRVKIILPQIGLNTEEMAKGVAIGSGYVTAANRLVRILPTRIDETSLDFDFILESAQRQTPGGSGSLSLDETGQLVISLALVSEPNTAVIFFSDTVVFFDPGVFVVPGNLEQISSLIELVSVSSRFRAGIVRKIKGDHAFLPADSELALITRIQPLTLTAGEILDIEGRNFGDTPIVHFPATEGDAIRVGTLSTGENFVNVVVPAGVGTGEVQVDSGLGPGPGHFTEMYFGPAMVIETVSDGEGEGIQIRIRQKDNLFSLESFLLDLLSAEPQAVAGLELDQVVGSLQWGPFPLDTLTVAAMEADRVVLEVSNGSVRRGDLIIERREETNPGWRLEFVPRFSRGFIEFQTTERTISIRLNLPFLVAEGESPLFTAQMTSARSAIGENSVSVAYQVGSVTEGAQ